jgi:hypothetical protein
MNSNFPDNYFDELIGLQLEIPGSHMSDNKDVVELYGPNLAGFFLVGFVTRYSFNRQTKEVRFEIEIPDLPEGKNTFKNKSLDFIFKYSEDVPYKFQRFKDNFVVAVARQASAEMPPLVEGKAIF